MKIYKIATQQELQQALQSLAGTINDINTAKTSLVSLGFQETSINSILQESFMNNGQTLQDATNHINTLITNLGDVMQLGHFIEAQMTEMKMPTNIAEMITQALTTGDVSQITMSLGYSSYSG